MKGPEIGEHVLFFKEGIADNEQPEHAQIVRVWDDATVNILIATHAGHMHAELGVPIADTPMPTRHVRYPNYDRLTRKDAA